MAIKKRLDKRRGVVSDDEAAWLRGDRNCGFIQFKRDEELQELWDRCGDHEATRAFACPRLEVASAKQEAPANRLSYHSSLQIF
jgi:hypothetical protein